jgi:predicted transcriptional regulator
MLQYGRDGRVTLTEKGQQVLFLRRCVNGLRAVAADPAATLDADVALFLGKKSHILARGEGGFEVTDKGRESLADIESQEKQK